MSEPIPDYVAAARSCYDLAGFRQVWTKAEANGHLDEVLRARLTPIGEALANAEMRAAPELSPAELAIVVFHFEQAADAPESARSRVAAAICPGDYCESHSECLRDADAAIDAMKAGAR